MGYRAFISIELEAEHAGDLFQKIQNLAQGYTFDSVHITRVVDMAAADGTIATATNGTIGAIPGLSLRAAANVAQPAEAAAQGQAAEAAPKPARQRKFQSGAQADTPKAETPKAEDPPKAEAAKPAAPKGKSHGELISELRGILAPHAAKGAAERGAVNSFIFSKGYKMVNESGIPADVLPGLIAEAQELFK